MVQISENLDCSIINIYKVEISRELIREKMQNKNEVWTVLTEDYVLELVEKLYLFELSVNNIREAYDIVGEITQDNGLDQVPFGEMYFNETGDTNLYPDQTFMPEPPEDATFPGRLRFFLHYVDLDIALLVDGVEITLPILQPMPTGLAKVMPYSPPN